MTSTTPPAPFPRKYVVLDLETTGLRASLSAKDIYDRGYNDTQGPPAVDEILEIAFHVLDGETLKKEAEGTWLVMPSLVKDEQTFKRWENKLRVENPFVADLHMTPRNLGPMREPGPSLLDDLHNAAVDSVADEMRYDTVEHELIAVLSKYVPAKVHPGNSPLVLTGNSIANLDIPLLCFWMPKLHKMLSYRIMDVSVLRTYFEEVTGTKLSESLSAAIKSGGGGHRALDDVKFCAEALRELKTWTKQTHAIADLCVAEGQRHG